MGSVGLWSCGLGVGDAGFQLPQGLRRSSQNVRIYTIFAGANSDDFQGVIYLRHRCVSER